AEMAEGARECWGLAEWEMVRGQTQRPHFRYLASLTSAQRQAAMSAAGLPFSQMSLAQQQQFIVGTQTDRLHSQEAMASAVLRVEHTQPGWFEWVVQEPSSRGLDPIKLPPVRDRPQAAALQAARRIDPQVDPAKIVP